MQREDMTGQHNTDNDDLRLRRITLADGRYMIFYTFGEAHDDGGARTTSAVENNGAPETDSQPISPAHAKEEQQGV